MTPVPSNGVPSNGVPADALAVLSRIAGNRPPPVRAGERCEMCTRSITDEHSHVVDLETRSLMCTCRPCYLLFTVEGAQTRFRAVPDRYLSFETFEMNPVQWEDLQIPVGLAFFFRNSRADRILGYYPGPAGAMESGLSMESWAEVLAANPELSVLADDVEALLVRNRTATRGARDERSGERDRENGGRQSEDFECFLVPIDLCYELVGRLRSMWRGFDGGKEARTEVEETFARVAGRARSATGLVSQRAGNGAP